MVLMTRRNMLKAGGVAAAYGAGLGVAGLWKQADAAMPMLLEARETTAIIDGKSETKGIMTWNDGPRPPVIRVQKGMPFSTKLLNSLNEPTTIHWHGLRIDNAMDGVPFLTQPYVYEGDTFDYSFTPPDAGTFWYHPHCNTLAQMGHGLAGLFIVENPDDPKFDREITLNLRDWRLGGDGQFIDQFKPRSAARSGTYGTVRTANWAVEPSYDVPAGGLVRVRIAVTDVTRIYRLGLEGADATVVAIDANPVPTPFPLDHLEVGPGQRLDLIVRVPDIEGETVRLVNYRSTPSYTIAALRSVGTSLNRDLREVKALPPNQLGVPDIKNAELLKIELSATAEGAPVKESFCGSLGYNFWAINKVPWSGDSPDPHDPLFELKMGKSYILEMANRTPHPHPMHLHGLSFKVLQSTDHEVMPIYTDTYVVQPDEVVQLALKADNPGDWVFHCHIIEHQKTGLTGFFRVV
ncbi:multicopper oxidase family protein [Rhizobium sp. L1K21]|uniref:multicopper oxidase family protein n=1 Tax=Rhizobium sp. L1K21 TaxID=2954933 RepID=UPI00209204C3|nr:multicopper oxidase family protein [Rhizobium sp. L1K21]MCO6186476.1 multicopper oxidase family protein [Rhizobium sp. L1K21]